MWNSLERYNLEFFGTSLPFILRPNEDMGQEGSTSTAASTRRQVPEGYLIIGVGPREKRLVNFHLIYREYRRQIDEQLRMA